MFYYINKNSILQWILILALTVWSVITIFTQMSLYPADNQMILYQDIYRFWVQNPLHYKITAVVMLLVEMSLIQWFYQANKLSENVTYMPVLFFLALVNAGKFLLMFTPAYFTVCIMTIVMLSNIRNDNNESIKIRIFFSGVLIGINTLFDPISIWIALFVIMALIANRFSKAKEIIILLSGLVTTYIYVFTVYYFSNQLPSLGKMLTAYPYFGIIHTLSTLRIVDMVMAGYVLLLTFYLSTTLKLFYDNKLIVLRKRLVTIHLLLFVTVVMLVFSDFDFQNALNYMLIPITLYLSMICLVKNRRWFHDFLIVALFVLLCL